MEYKINIQKLIVLPLTNNKWKIKFKIPFTIISENAKYLGINLTKYVWYLYTENYKSFLRKILEDLSRDIHIYHVHGLKASMLLKWQCSSNWSIDSMQF